jgi:hypothetical protein
MRATNRCVLMIQKTFKGTHWGGGASMCLIDTLLLSCHARFFFFSSASLRLSPSFWLLYMHLSVNI